MKKCLPGPSQCLPGSSLCLPGLDPGSSSIKKKFLAFLSLLFLFLPLASFANKHLTLALDWYINPDQAAILVAKTEHFFQKNHLDVTLVTPVETSEPLKLVSLGRADLAITYEPEWIKAINRGFPLVWVATMVSHPLDCLLTLKSSHINHFSDLKGKLIGFSSSGRHLIVRTMLGYHHVPQNSVKFVNVNMSLIQALITHRVAAVSGAARNVEAVELRQKGFPVKLFYPEDNGMPMYSELMLVSKKGRLSALVKKEVQLSLKEATLFLRKHPWQAWKSMLKAYPAALAPTPSTQKVNRAIFEATISTFTVKPGYFNQVQYKNLKSFIKKHNKSL